MFGSSILDVAVGVIFIFLLLSVFATTIHELIFSFFNMRGRALLRGIKNLLDDPTAANLASNVYNHGQVFGLYDGSFNPDKPGKLPSYIPARNFALALLGSVAPSFSEVKQSATTVTPQMPTGTPSAASPSATPGSSASVQPATGTQVAVAVQETVVLSQGFKDAIEALAKSNDKVGKPLLAMMNMAGNDAAKMQKSVEEWFNSGMDRVSGWYKYKTQWTLFFIGLFIACVLNASTTRFVSQLSQDSTLRASLVAAAESAKNPDSKGDQTTQDRIAATEKAFSGVTSLGIPLGWHAGDWDRFSSTPKHAANIVLGWLITAIAISLGAPFWFDILNKIMVIRSTVKPREKSHDEGSKD